MKWMIRKWLQLEYKASLFKKAYHFINIFAIYCIQSDKIQELSTDRKWGEREARS